MPYGLLRATLVSAFARLDHRSPQVEAFRAAYAFRLREADPIEAAGGLPAALERAFMLHTPNPDPLPDPPRLAADATFVNEMVEAAERVSNSAYHHLALWLERFKLTLSSEVDADAIVKTSLYEYARYAGQHLTAGPS